LWRRQRRCINGPPGEGDCAGDAEEVGACNVQVRSKSSTK